MRQNKIISIILACLMFSCSTQPNPWEDINYRSVYLRAQQREVDQFYQQPASIGCLEDDLYECQ